MIKKKDAIIGYIKNNQQKKIKQYREEQYVDFLPWAEKKFKVTKAEITAGYHKAFEIFCQKIKADQFHSKTAKPSSFLFGIGRNCMMKIKYPKKIKKKKIVSVAIETIADSSNTMDKKMDDDHNKKVVAHYLNKLTPHCADLIRANKLEEKSITEIMQVKNYKNYNTAKGAISKCYGCLIKIAMEVKRKGKGVF